MKLDLAVIWIAKKFLLFVLYSIFVPILFLFAFICRFKRRSDLKPRLLWGFRPIINNKYFAKALSVSYKSNSCVVGLFSINKASDFDIVLGSDIFQLPRFIFWIFKSLYCYDIFHISFYGGLLRYLGLGSIEPYVYKVAGIKTVLIAYGSDVHVYDKISNKSYANTLMSFYPQTYYARGKTIQQINRWTKHADVIIPGMLIPNGFPRWDVVVPNFVVIDSSNFPDKKRVTLKKIIKVVHTPNHKIIKGTEYIIDAIKKLQSEGFPVELILLEGYKNDEVLNILSHEADILADQLVGSCYGLSGIEGMALGLPVIGNISTIDWEYEMNLFYRYSFLSECPILNANVDTITDTLRLLCSSPELRESLGNAGISYTRKYHSYETANYLFNKIYSKIWFGNDIDLLNLFHPIHSSYVKNNPIANPLSRNYLK